MWRQTQFVSTPYKNVEKIYPLKQHIVEELIAHCKTHYPRITRIVVFGSSVTSRCNPWSDLDIYLEGIERGEGFIPPQNDAYDIWSDYKRAVLGPAGGQRGLRCPCSRGKSIDIRLNFAEGRIASLCLSNAEVI